MKKILILFFILFSLNSYSQNELKKIFKFSTFYAAANGGTSLSNVDVYSITDGLTTTTIETPFDYSLALGVRKIARMGYEPKEAFKNGQENSFSDAATIGKVKGFEFLFEVDYKRQEGIEYLDQHHFLRYVSECGDDKCTKPLCIKNFTAKIEYLQDGFADIEYFEASERYRYKYNNKLSFNLGAVQRLSEPYGYDPLGEWKLSNGNLHYTYLALEEGYNVNFISHDIIQYLDPQGNIVAENNEVWEAVVIPQVLADYTEKKRDQQDNTIQHSLVIGFDYYHYTKTFWLHSWGNLMPWHYNDGSEFSYQQF